MKKLLILVAAAGLGLGTIGCEKKAPPPTTPATDNKGGETKEAPPSSPQG